MSGKTLNIKRVRDTIIWFSLIAGIAALLFFSINRKTNAGVKTLVVKIEGIEGDERLITDKEVAQILTLAAGKSLTKANIKSLNIRKLEAKLNKDKRIERADIYFDSKDRLNVRIIQKKPVVRIIEEAGAGYYLDENGKQVPVTSGSVVRVPIVTGLKEEFDPAFLTSKKPSKLKDIFTIMQYVKKDAFLSSLIEQVNVEQDSIGDIVLIPKIGREKLIFGSALGMEEKFDNLKIFYREGLPRLGWSRYKSLNLKYSNQIAGTLSNPNTAKIKMPVLKDSLQATLVTDINKKESIHH
ncbi:MAG: hypothetical protein IPO92_12505 [Saprospiraceae bacterium]|nr:hypothetical protein [Saprospiraceae bacterium]